MAQDQAIAEQIQCRQLTPPVEELPLTITGILFNLNGKPAILAVNYAPNQSLTASSFDLLAGCGFDVNMCLGYPTMRAYVQAYKGTGYYTASAWIQIITRQEPVSEEADAPVAMVANVDVNDTLDGHAQGAQRQDENEFCLGGRSPPKPSPLAGWFLGGYPAEIHDVPCNNLGDCGEAIGLATADHRRVSAPPGLGLIRIPISVVTGTTWRPRNACGNDSHRVSLATGCGVLPARILMVWLQLRYSSRNVTTKPMAGQCLHHCCAPDCIFPVHARARWRGRGSSSGWIRVATAG